jgi:hypothetical protein
MISVHEFPSLAGQGGLVRLGEDPVSIVVDDRSLLTQRPVNLNRDGAKVFPRQFGQLREDFRRTHERKPKSKSLLNQLRLTKKSALILAIGG